MELLQLEELEPRLAGNVAVDPSVTFPASQPAHEMAACPLTCGCGATSAVCYPTGASAFEDLN